MNISSFDEDHDIESPVFLDHEFTALHASLATLEEMIDIKLGGDVSKYERHVSSKKNPIRQEYQVRIRGEIGASDLGEVYGLPYLIVVEKPNTVRLQVIGVDHDEITEECQPVLGFDHYVSRQAQRKARRC